MDFPPDDADMQPPPPPQDDLEATVAMPRVTPPPPPPGPRKIGDAVVDRPEPPRPRRPADADERPAGRWHRHPPPTVTVVPAPHADVGNPFGYVCARFFAFVLDIALVTCVVTSLAYSLIAINPITGLPTNTQRGFDCDAGDRPRDRARLRVARRGVLRHDDLEAGVRLARVRGARTFRRAGARVLAQLAATDRRA